MQLAPKILRVLRLAPLVALLAASCAGPDVAQKLSQAGFRSPRQTFDTYRAAFLSDLIVLEYSCLSAGFKRANGITITNYGEAREILLRDQSFLRFGLSRAEVVKLEALAEDRVRLQIRSESLFHEVDFACELVLEDFYEIWAGEDRLQDDYLGRFRDAFRITPDADNNPIAQSWVPLEQSIPATRITEFRVGREWKIDFITLLDPNQTADSNGFNSPEERQAP